MVAAISRVQEKISPMRFIRSLLVLFAVVVVLCQKVPGQELASKKTPEGIEISERGVKVLFYQTKPKSSDGKYERANYVHPLYGLKGTILTEDFPEDHPHHRGIFWAWHQIIHNGKQIADGWSCENISWKVMKTDIEKKRGLIALNNEVIWRSSPQGKQDVPIIRENSRITVHRATAHYRILDFEISLHALIDSLAIGGSDDPKGYGGFSLRLKLPDDIAFLWGNKRLEARELAVEGGPWLDFHGSFQGKGSPPSGVTVFCHPLNPGPPEPWILRSAKSMQNPAFPGRHPVALTKDGLTLRYRVVVHSDQTDPRGLEKLYREYAQRKFQ